MSLTPREIGFLVAICIYTSFWFITCLLCFLWRKQEPLRSRGVGIAIWQCTAGEIHLLILSFERIFGWTCYAVYFSTALFVVCWLYVRINQSINSISFFLIHQKFFF